MSRTFTDQELDWLVYRLDAEGHDPEDAFDAADAIRFLRAGGWSPVLQQIGHDCAGTLTISLDEAAVRADATREMAKALGQILAIPNAEYGGDWDEIEVAREIARAALEKAKTPPAV